MPVVPPVPLPPPEPAVPPVPLVPPELLVPPEPLDPPLELKPPDPEVPPEPPEPPVALDPPEPLPPEPLLPPLALDPPEPAEPPLPVSRFPPSVLRAGAGLLSLEHPGANRPMVRIEANNAQGRTFRFTASSMVVDPYNKHRPTIEKGERCFREVTRRS